MGGFFGVSSRKDCLGDVFFGVDYHSHLGTKLAGMAAYDPEIGLQREIHNISDNPFRAKFTHVFNDMKATSAIGCISDTDPQPLLVRSSFATYAICMTGLINNAQELIDKYLSTGIGYFDVMTGGKVNSTELLASLINEKDSFAEGIKFAHQAIEGTASILILRDDGHIIAARDRYGILPVIICKGEDGFAVTMEDFAAEKLGYEYYQELGPGEVVDISPEGITRLVEPGKKKRICAFLWSYYGYPTSTYEGVNVETMRYRNGAIMAKTDEKNGVAQDIDYVGGVPDSGTPHAIGYANESHKPFARAFIKYTPTWSRSFTPPNQKERDRIAKMKQLPVHELIEDKNLLFVDDSIVRGTQLRETVEFLYNNGAKSVHIRSACPPIMFKCKYLNFSRAKSDMELIARRVIMDLEGEEGVKHIDEYSDGSTERGRKLKDEICRMMGFTSLEYQSLEGVIKAIGLPECELCTYCWSGRENDTDEN